MECPVCKCTEFVVVLDLSHTDSATQILTQKDLLCCKNCGQEYSLGELAELNSEPVTIGDV